jgi:hypothetical protein
MLNITSILASSFDFNEINGANKVDAKLLDIHFNFGGDSSIESNKGPSSLSAQEII